MIKKIFILINLFLSIILQLTPTSICDDIEDNNTIDVTNEIISSSTTSQSEIKTPETNSRSCVVIDRNSNTVLYGKNENSKRKMASTTKIMTAIIIIENYNLDETIEVSKKAAGTGGSRLGLKTGDKITIRDLLYGLMLCSGNDAAVALAEYAGNDIPGFAKLMNKKANALGLKDTNFETPHGLDADNHYTTAYELATLSNYALNNKTFSQIVGTKNYTVTINGSPKQLSNTNELLGNLDGVYGIKTGFTNGANRCLVTACKRNDMDIICVVLGADTKKFRTSDSIKLINYIFDNFKPVNIKEKIYKDFEKWKNENLNKVIVNKGISQNINLEIENINNSIIPIRKDLIDSINISINCSTIFEAPLPEKTTIGNIHITISENVILDYNIYNSSEIKRKSWSTYILDILKNYPNILEKNLI
ncbi:MAG: D-alanyl-D-alanine carboxypeptidase [Clostridia bacterium]|nr:D-alanyl-D-alanine carboxypeptidase [Clostridia bacterium]